MTQFLDSSILAGCMAQAPTYREAHIASSQANAGRPSMRSLQLVQPRQLSFSFAYQTQGLKAQSCSEETSAEPIQMVEELLRSARDCERTLVDRTTPYSADSRVSASNFAAYLAVRQKDLRVLQRTLHRIGLSSLGRLESHTLDSLQRVLWNLADMNSASQVRRLMPASLLDYDSGERILANRTTRLFGRRHKQRSVRIMVTVPSEAADHYELVRGLVASGMDVMRINCAHDDPAGWERMAQNLRRASAEIGSECKLLCDLAGPKLRTGPIETGPGVIRWHAFKNNHGEVLEPARVWITSNAPAPQVPHAVLPVDQAFLGNLRTGDEIHFSDYQARKRWLTVSEVCCGGVWAEGHRGAFVVEGIALRLRRGGLQQDCVGRVGSLPPLPHDISLRAGDCLVLTSSDIPGRPAQAGPDGSTLAPAQIGCSLPEVFRSVQPGQRIFFDDGKIAGAIEEVRADRLVVRISWTRSAVATLGQEKGINLPDTDLRTLSITPKDRQDLAFLLGLTPKIDAVALSFVRDAQDVEMLYQELSRAHASRLGVIIKIETLQAYENLPRIILAALRREAVGLMIARGDLGVEVGFEHMAEIQEEILSLCGAAHLPVVWATQVLESLAKKGMPSRAEVSDVVMGARTQCVMLNKGPHVIAAVKFLAEVLGRLDGQQERHFRLMRPLRFRL